MVWTGGGTRRLAKSLITLIDEVDAKYPDRDRSNDGTIGDTSHQARRSDQLDHGSGAGAAFQRLCKISPAFAVEAAAVGLRAIGGKAPHGHWGPISRKEAEIRPEADALLAQVQQMVEAPIVVPPFPIPLPQPGPAPVPSPPPVIGDFVTAVLTQLISLLKERLMSLQSIGTQPA